LDDLFSIAMMCESWNI